MALPPIPPQHRGDVLDLAAGQWRHVARAVHPDRAAAVVQGAVHLSVGPAVRTAATGIHPDPGRFRTGVVQLPDIREDLSHYSALRHQRGTGTQARDPYRPGTRTRHLSRMR